MRKSEQINEIASALAKAQGEMRPAELDATNPHFRSKHSSLASTREASREPLSKNGIAVVQDVTSGEKGVYVETMLMHSSGQWLEFGPLFIPTLKTDAQAFGSGSTYAQRYALRSALLIVSGEEDDDGNAATASVSTYTSNGCSGFTSSKMSESQHKYLISLLTSHPSDTAEKIALHYKVPTVNDLNASQASEAINKLKSKDVK